MGIIEQMARSAIRTVVDVATRPAPPPTPAVDWRGIMAEARRLWDGTTPDKNNKPKGDR